MGFASLYPSYGHPIWRGGLAQCNSREQM